MRIMHDSSLRLEGEWAHRLGDQALERLRQELADLADIASDGETHGLARPTPQPKGRYRD
jgi:hypothetical protein